MFFVLMPLLPLCTASLPDPYDCQRYCHASESACSGVASVSYSDQFASWDDCLVGCALIPTNGSKWDFVGTNTLQCRTNHLDYINMDGMPAAVHCAHASVGGGGMCSISSESSAVLAREGAGRQVFLSGDTVVDGAPSLGKLSLSVSYLNSLRLRLSRHTVFQATPTQIFEGGHRYKQTAQNGGDTTCQFHLDRRSADGRCTSLDQPEQGRAHSLFGRMTRPWEPETPARAAEPQLDRVEKLLLAPRRKPRALAWFSQLATAWTQFMVHDWFDHRTSDQEKDVGDAEGSPCNHGKRRGKLRSKLAGAFDPPSETTREGGHGVNTVTHWWDASQLYGSSWEEQQQVRDGRYLRLDCADEIEFREGEPVTGFRSNWWVGLHALHTLFAREHNYVVDQIHQAQPTLPDDVLFQKGRLVVSALLAKIHTLEWTPTLLHNMPQEVALMTNWHGLDAVVGQFVPPNPTNATKALLDQIRSLSDRTRGLDGIGADTAVGASPFQMTEEFVAAYRMHPLLPDEMVVDGHPVDLAGLVFQDPRLVAPVNTTSHLLRALGTTQAGQLTLRNYPRSLQSLEVPGADEPISLAKLDVYRDRERGVLRYNAMRRQFNMQPLTSFDDYEDKMVAKMLRRTYDSVEDIDFMVGCLAEDKGVTTFGRPSGFGFGELQYRIFVVMASRRLAGDRFYQEFYNADVYTTTGFLHVQSQTMTSVLNRHFPELATMHANLTTPFYQWVTGA
jgi:hypothetical protein